MYMHVLCCDVVLPCMVPCVPTLAPPALLRGNLQDMPSLQRGSKCEMVLFVATRVLFVATRVLNVHGLGLPCVCHVVWGLPCSSTAHIWLVGRHLPSGKSYRAHVSGAHLASEKIDKSGGSLWSDGGRVQHQVYPATGTWLLVMVPWVVVCVVCILHSSLPM